MGNEDYLPLDSLGIPSDANAQALNRVLGKAGRYLRKLPDAADRLHTELQRAVAAAHATGLVPRVPLMLAAAVEREMAAQEQLVVAVRWSEAGERITSAALRRARGL